MSDLGYIVVCSLKRDMRGTDLMAFELRERFIDGIESPLE